MLIDAACQSVTGLVRENNEDNFLFDGAYLDENNTGMETARGLSFSGGGPHCFCVFDGMGGEAGGETAAYTAAKKMSGLLLSGEGGDSPEDFLLKSCMAMNSAVCGVSRRLRSGRMGSAAVMLYFSGGAAFVCNVGDSRAYLLRDGGLRQLSVDHTDAEFLASRGITARRPSLTQHLGIFPGEMTIEPHIARRESLAGDVWLLCSDGLTDALGDERIRKLLLEEREPVPCAERLIYEALCAGGRDNVTVVVCRVG